MADLKYSLELLRGLGRDLDGMARSLDGVAARTNWTEQGIGHSRVANALEDFAGSSQAFQEIDDELAAQIRDAVEGVQ